MPKSLPKIIASILLGMVFLLGGAGVVSAQATAVDQANSILKAVSCTDWVDCLQKLPTLIPLDISYALYILTAGILALAGYAFDSVLTMSIDHTFILKPFIDTMWTTIRDFSNMAFIFILLYTGIITMLGTPGWAKTVRNVVIIALLINFSLFFTKVVIDAGNILAVGVYEALAPVKTQKIHTTPAVGGLQERDLSLELTKHFGPQAILGKSADVSSPFLAIMLFVIGAVVNILAAWAFFRVALMFIGRIIGFWVLMIISPFAFISIAFPGGKTAVFDKWLKNLLGLSFVAPVFLFFLYIIMQVLSSGAIASTLVNPNPDSFAKFSLDILFVPVLMVIFIYMALDKAVSISKQMAGGFGDLGAKIGGAVMGAGAASVAMTGGVGVRALSDVGAKFGGRGGVLGAIGDASARVGHAGRNMTFDARNIPIPLAGGTVGSHTGTGAGRTATFAQTRVEAVKHAEEKAKREEEKPESINQAIKEAEEKREEKNRMKEKRIPELEKKIVATKKAVDDISTANGGLQNDANGDALTLQLKANLRSAEANARVAEENAVRTPNDGQAQVDFLRAKRDRESAEKNLKKVESASDDIEKMEKQLEEYKK